MHIKTKLLSLGIMLSVLVQFVNADVFFPADDPHIQLYGRWDTRTPSAPKHSWPGVYIYATFEGTSIGARFDDNFNYFNVFIDGKLHSIFHPTKTGIADYTLAQGLEDSVHTLLLTKRNESWWGTFGFHGLILDDGSTLLEPPDRPARKIEFLGDSFTSASGNEATTVGVPPNTELVTNIYEGFGPIIARNYGAQYHMTSISGIGLVLDYTEDYTNNLPDRFNRVISGNTTLEWEFSQWIPNLVVIGLGLNDYSGFGGWEGTLENEETELYKARYHEFIGTIRDVYPGVRILAVATHVEWMRTTIAEIVAEENAAGNLDVSYAQYSYYPGGYVNNGHPNVETHYGIAAELISFIDTINAWEPYIDNNPPVITNYPDTHFVSYASTFDIMVETDSYATLKYDYTDLPYEDMVYTFTETGYRDHILTFTGEHEGDYTLYIKAADMGGNITPVSTVISFSIDTTKALLNWYDPDYILDDWGNGPAWFGQEGDQKTVTSVQDVNTIYFRKEFEVDDPSSVTGFGILVKGSDGAVVYLNGREIGRINMFQTDEVSYTSYAMKSADLNQMLVINDPAHINLVHMGSNVLAIEMHKALSGSEGVAFDCQMIDQNYQMIFGLGSEWSFLDSGIMPPSIIVDISTDVQSGSTRPSYFSLHQNYPNPFNPVTTISYEVPYSTEVTLKIYDINGRITRTLTDGQQTTGWHSVQWRGKDDSGNSVSTGVYFARVQTGKYSAVIKMLYLK